MKRKKLSKKLVLKKQTIADLNIGEMKSAVGGEFTDAVTCIACPSEECPVTETGGPEPEVSVVTLCYTDEGILYCLYSNGCTNAVVVCSGVTCDGVTTC